MKSFKKHRDYSFFDQDIRLSKLTQLGDPLEKLNQGINFELFRDILENNLIKLSKGAGGRPPYDYLLMFKILILQRFYNLSDDQTEYQINDRMSFMRFLNLTIADDIPDSKTVWNFKEQLIDLQLIEPIFNLFLKKLNKLGLVLNQGRIIDASFIEMPKKRNSLEENKEIKSGGVPDKFSDNPNKLAQKDLDARWTKKNAICFFGYKNHIKIDDKSEIITKYHVTDASVHDSQALDILLDDTDIGQDLHADSAYVGQKQDATIEKYQINNKVHEKGYKDAPLTEIQKESNTEKSRTHARVEHIFGFMENTMNSMTLDCIGIKRATENVGMMNLVYNMFRKIQLSA